MNDLSPAAARAALPTPPTTADQLVAQFVAIRDKIKEADDAHKARTKAARDYKDLLEGKLQDLLNLIGGDSVKTPHGTAYRTTRRTATIADGQAFRDYVTANSRYDLLDWKANASSVDDFIKDNQVPPPGINFALALTIGVRRA